MKKLLLYILILVPSLSFSQTIVNQGTTSTLTINKGAFQVEGVLTIPRIGTGLWFGRTGNIAIDNPTNRLKYHDGTQWVFVQDANSSSFNAEILEVNGNGSVYSISTVPIPNSLTATVNGVEVKYTISGTMVTLITPYTIDAGDKIRLHYFHN